MTRTPTYTYTLVKPTGADTAFWRFARCDGDYVFLGINGGRLYASSNRGASWSEQQPAGNTARPWHNGDVAANGNMIAADYGYRLYAKISGSWSEQRPAGDANKNWEAVAISSNGTRMLAGINNGRLYSYYDGSWTEEQPLGAADELWYRCHINDVGDMIAASIHRLWIKPAGGSWAETQPDGASDRTWRGCAVSDDGTVFIACVDGRYAWRYADSAWTKIVPNRMTNTTDVYKGCDCDGAGDKIVLNRGANYNLCNAAMSDVHSHHLWPTLAGSGSESCGGISSDGSLVVTARYGGPVYIYDQDTLPDQITNGYCKEFTVTHAVGTRYNYKVRIRIYNKYVDSTVLHCEGRANDDFSDIYFKNAVGDTLRHCIIADDSSQNALHTGYYRYVWIELDEIGTSPTTFYLHYGDSEHSDSSTAPASFFDSYDNFERGVNTDAVGGAWTITAGAVQITTDYAWKGTRSAEFIGGPTTKGAANIAAVAGDETYVGFWAYKHGTAGLVAQHGDGTTYAQWSWSKSETLLNYTGGGDSASLMSMTADTWYQIEMRDFKWADDTYDLLVNNSTKGNNLAMQASAGYTDILQLATLAGSSSCYMDIDELVICTNCNPYASPDAESIGVEVVVGTESPGFAGPAGVKTWNDIPSANIKAWNDIPWNIIKAMN